LELVKVFGHPEVQLNNFVIKPEKVFDVAEQCGISKDNIYFTCAETPEQL
jgi:hypothetical protein